ILHVAQENPALADAIRTARDLLFAEREKRIKPGRDEKMLAAWNGLMLAAYAEAARVFPDSREKYTMIARRNAEFLLTQLSMPDGRLYRTHKNGESKLNGYLEDYACVIDGLLELYQTTFEPRWFTEAQRLTDHALAHFQSEDGGGFYDTSDDHETLVARPRSLMDNAVPGANNVMAYNLVRMGAYTGQPEYETAALTVFKQVLHAVEQYPSAFGMALIGINFLVRRAVEVAIIGDISETRPVLEALQKPFRPRVITAFAPEDQDADARPQLLAFRTQRGGQPTIYVCQNFTCAAPVHTIEGMEKLLANS
ncbi:MAG: thioredoxin domain-containing protein, partial [Anaerolineae bacterium]|nr:thioredoxin domain-containing protein [Anaerolineae bacterium]